MDSLDRDWRLGPREVTALGCSAVAGLAAVAAAAARVPAVCRGTRRRQSQVSVFDLEFDFGKIQE